MITHTHTHTHTHIYKFRYYSNYFTMYLENICKISFKKR